MKKATRCQVALSSGKMALKLSWCIDHLGAGPYVNYHSPAGYFLPASNACAYGSLASPIRLLNHAPSLADTLHPAGNPVNPRPDRPDIMTPVSRVPYGGRAALDIRVHRSL